ncbi:hypothetical protein CAPTEDRAFT_201866, partial [Capitella teleta]
MGIRNNPTRKHLDIKENFTMGWLTALQRELSRSLLDRGVKPGTIARQMECNASTIRCLHQRAAETGSTTDRLRTGRPKVTTERQDRQIRRAQIQNRFKIAVVTARGTREIHNRLLSARTVSRRLQELRLRSRIRYRGSILNAERCHRRLQWTRFHQRWTLQRWRSVLFTGKGRICLVMSDRRRLVWRTWGEQFWDCCIQEQDGWGGASIMVCGGISYNSKTPILVIEWNWNTR